MSSSAPQTTAAAAAAASTDFGAAPPALAAVTTAAAASGSAASDASSIGTSAILNRLKEIESNNQALQATIDRMKGESQSKEEKIKALSADKRKDMEQMIETAIDNWLNSLTGVQEDVRKQFRQGISKIAEQADMKNAAWEVR